MFDNQFQEYRLIYLPVFLTHLYQYRQWPKNPTSVKLWLSNRFVRNLIKKSWNKHQVKGLVDKQWVMLEVDDIDIWFLSKGQCQDDKLGNSDIKISPYIIKISGS